MKQTSKNSPPAPAQDISTWFSTTTDQIRAELQMLQLQVAKNEVETNRLNKERTELNNLIQQKLGAFMLIDKAGSDFAVKPPAPMPDIPVASDAVAETSGA
jgi:hypothetical protein